MERDKRSRRGRGRSALERLRRTHCGSAAQSAKAFKREKEKTLDDIWRRSNSWLKYRDAGSYVL
jgi:hypothetical protein